jgi:hypothetical protein
MSAICIVHEVEIVYLIQGHSDFSGLPSHLSYLFFLTHNNTQYSLGPYMTSQHQCFDVNLFSYKIILQI